MLNPAADPVVPVAPPSGAQYELRLADQRAEVAAVGATLRSYSVGGRDVIVPFRADQLSPASNGWVLLPWPNRLRDGQYDFDGGSHQLPLTEPERGTAIHGLVSWERWVLQERAESRVTLSLDSVPVPGYPFPLRVVIRYELASTGLDVTLTTTNLGSREAPYGVGFHPWLSPGPGARLDDCTVTIDAQTWVPTDDRLLPTGYEPVPPRMDYRGPRRLGTAQLDDAFVDATFTEGRSWVQVVGGDGRTASAWMAEPLTCWQVCTGDAIQDPDYRRSGFAAEPMTCTADAFRTGDRLIRLAPQGTHEVRWGLALAG